MTYPTERWHELGEHLIRRRVALGFPKRAEFARHLRLTHDRTLSDIENARRDNYSAATLGQVEGYYQLAVRAIPDFLEGAPELVADPGAGSGGIIVESAVAHGRDLDGMIAVVTVAGTTARNRADRGEEAGAWDALYAAYTLLTGAFTGAQPPTTLRGHEDGTAIADEASTQPPDDGATADVRTLHIEDEAER